MKVDRGKQASKPGGFLPQQQLLREQPMSTQELIGQELIQLQRLL